MSGTKENKNDKPVFNIRSGSVQGAVWKNQTKAENKSDVKEFLTYSLKRTYLVDGGDAKNPEDWKETNSYRVTDTSDIDLVTKKCHEFIRVTSKEQDKE